MKNTLLIVLLCLSAGLFAQDQTVGLFKSTDEVQDGYVLFSPNPSTSTYLIDNCGRLVHEWESTFKPGVATVLLENGNLLRASSMGAPTNPVFNFGGAGERIQEIDWDGNVVWEFEYSDDTHRMHHDFKKLPNGNVIFPAWELKSNAEAIAAGRNPDLLPEDVMWTEFIVEVDPETDEIVWEWHLWDHLIQDFDDTKDNYGVIADHPELFDINVTGGPSINGEKNWLHVNAIDYNPMMDQILFNSFFVNEFFIIDHSTTTAQAAGHTDGNSTKGGDLIYRWGNPENYDHGTADDRKIFGAHRVHWITEGLEDEGYIMYFHNGNGRPTGTYSSIDIIIPPVNDYLTGQYIYDPGLAYGPSSPSWSYSADPAEDFHSNILSSAQRLSNGNTIICSGVSGRFFEINDQKEIVWEYINPVIGSGPVTQGDVISAMSNAVFRCTKYESDYPGLAGKDLTPGDPIELDFIEPYTICSSLITGINDEEIQSIQIYPNPAQNLLNVETRPNVNILVQIFNTVGQLQEEQYSNGKPVTSIDITHYNEGIYFIKLDNKEVKKIIISR